MTRNPRPCRWLIFVSVLALLYGLAPFSVAEEKPEFRPALLGNGPKSLVNLIDVQKLLQQGQSDAVVMFDEMIFPFRVKGSYGTVYRGTHGSEALQKAVMGALDKAEFIPAIAHHKPAAVDFRGTVMFFANQKPHLRVFANQDPVALAHFDDFIAPQLIGGSAKWDPNDKRLEAARSSYKKGVVVLSLHVNERGELLSSKMISEDPGGFDLGAVLLKSFATARFIPGFRNAKPADCAYETTEYVVANGRIRGEVTFQ